MNAHVRLPTALETILSAHNCALANAEDMWNRVSAIEDMNELPCVRVAFSRRRPRGDEEADDAEGYVIQYAYSLHDLDANLDRQRREWRAIFGEKFAKISELEQLYAEKKREFERVSAERDAAEERCGLTAAKKAAGEASRFVTECRHAICTHAYQTADELRAAFTHLRLCGDNDATFQLVRQLSGLAGEEA